MMDFYKYTDKEIDALLNSMVIVVDSREQKNAHLLQYWDSKKVPHAKLKLDYGDYTAMIPKNLELGIVRDLYFDNKVVIERKASLEELSSNLCQGRTAFENEFIRAGNAKVHLLIENALYEDIISHNYKTDYKPVSFIPSLHSFADRFNISITFMKNNKYSGYFIFMTFKYALRNYLLKR